MIKELTLFITALALFGTVMAQEANEQYNIAPPSPEVAAFMKYGDIPVGHYTGAANISIPLYSIQDDGFNIPIILNYHTSGIQVEQEATWVGLGWDLTVGGAITKIPVGEPDETDNLFRVEYEQLINNNFRDGLNTDAVEALEYGYELRNEVGSAHILCVDLQPGDNWEQPSMLYKLGREAKGQPDIYQFNFMGHSGKFFIDPSDRSTIRQLKKQEEMDFSRFDPFNESEWELRTVGGIEYVFGAEESTVDVNSTLNFGNSLTRKLTAINLPNGREIGFEYQKGYYETCNCSESETFAYDQYNEIFSNRPLTATTSRIGSDVQYLKKVTGTNVIVEFILSDREDLKGKDLPGTGFSAKKLDKITIRERYTDKKLKEFRFSYGYFDYSTLGGDYTNPGNPAFLQQNCEDFTEDNKGKRLKLNSVKEVGYSTSGQIDLSKPPYTFSYDESQPLPLKTTFARDYWGYFNGEMDNNSLVPDIKILLATAPGGLRANYDNGPSVEVTNALGFTSNIKLQIDGEIDERTLFRSGANRGASEAPMKVGTLKRITYPTGGKTELELEAHSFNNFIAPTAQQVKEWNNTLKVRDNDDLESIIPSSSVHELPEEQTILWIDEMSFTRGGTDISYDDFRTSYITVTGISENGGVSEIARYQMNQDNGAREEFNSNESRGIAIRNTLLGIDGDRFARVSVQATMILANGATNDNFHTASVSVSYRLVSSSTFLDGGFVGGGLRTRSVTSFDGTDEVGKIIYGYENENGEGSGQLLSPLDFYSHSEYDVCTYEVIDSGGGQEPIYIRQQRPSNGTYEDRFASISYVPLSTSANGNPVGYGRVVETAVGKQVGLDRPAGQGSTVHTFHNGPDRYTEINGLHLPNIANYKNGLPVTVAVLDFNGRAVSERSYEYTTLERTVIKGVMAKQRYFGSTGCTNGTFDGCLTPETRHYDLGFYPLVTEWNKTSNVTSTQYGTGANSTGLTTVTSSVHNSFGMEVSNETTNSDGSVWRTETEYLNEQPKDVVPLPFAVTWLDNNFAHAVPFRTTRYVDGTKVFEQRNEFGPINEARGNWGVPTKVTTYPTGDLSYDSHYDLAYDNSGHLSSVAKDDGTLIQYIWGHNRTRVVAQVTNASGAVVGSALGSSENLDTGGLTRAQETALRSIPGAHTNTYRHNLLRGVTEMTDPNGNRSYYRYDGLGRLVQVLDRDSFTVQQYEYTYDQN